MSPKKFVPIVAAAVIVLGIFISGERKKGDDHNGIDIDVHVDSSDDDSDNGRRDRKQHRNKTSQFALDVQRVDWPPLGDSANNANAASPKELTATNYYVVLDGSGSMQSNRCGGGTSKIEAAVNAVKHFFSTVPADANVGLAVFDKRAVAERVPLGVGNRDALQDALDKIKAGADTPLYSTMKIGYEKLTDQARAQLGYGEYHLVVVTDGEPDPDSEDPTPIVKKILSESPVVLHTIGFCIDSDHVLNQPKKTFYASATDPQELESSLKAVLAEAPSYDATKFK